jgi:hypothetical protein
MTAAGAPFRRACRFPDFLQQIAKSADSCRAWRSIYSIPERIEQKHRDPQEHLMRNRPSIATISVISAAAALSFLCAMATQGDNYEAGPPVATVASAH